MQSSPTQLHSFIPSLPLNIALSIFLSCHLFLFKLISCSPSPPFSLLLFLPFLFHPLLLARSFFFLSSPLLFPFSLSLPPLWGSCSPFLSLLPPPSLTLSFSCIFSSLLILSLSISSSLSCHHILSFSLSLFSFLFLFSLSLSKKC